MTDYPITPPPELVQQWIAEIWHEGTPVQVAQGDLHLAARAAQWGADTELEAIIRLAGEAALPEKDRYFDGLTVAAIRAARRPKPQTLSSPAHPSTIPHHRRRAARHPRPHGDTMTDPRALIQRLLALAEQAVNEALDLAFEEPEERYIWRELQELKQMAEKAVGGGGGMTDHPITPPPELVQKWFNQAELANNRIHCIATRAAKWGYEQRGEINEAKAADEAFGDG